MYLNMCLWEEVREGGIDFILTTNSLGYKSICILISSPALSKIYVRVKVRLTCFDDGKSAGISLGTHDVGGPAGECPVVPRWPEATQRGKSIKG